jgi:hypothetical protein
MWSSIRRKADNIAQVAAARAAKAAAPAGGGLQGPAATGGAQEPPADSGVKEPPAAEGGLQEPPAEEGLKEPGDTAKEPAEAGGLQAPPGSEDAKPAAAAADAPLQEIGEPSGSGPQTAPVPESFYTGFAIACVLMAGLLLWYYRRFDAEQFEILRMLVFGHAAGRADLRRAGVILFGITTATESAAVGAAGAFLMAWHAGTLNFQRIKEAVFLTCKTTSMVCWLFVGSALFSAVFALLGGQRVVEEWVLSMNLSPLQFLLLSQAIIFVLGWPLEWTEIIVIFVPIFLPLLQHFQIDPILWGVLVFVNLQAAFLSPPVAMSASI